MSGWNWRPELGNWRIEEHGWPTRPTAMSVSTAGARPLEAYDFWRSFAFPDFEADALPPGERGAFRAAADLLIWEGADLYSSESSAVSGGRHRRHIERDGLDNLTVGLVVKGRRDAVHAADAPISTGAGGFFVYDAARPSQVSWGRHKVVYLVIRRQAAEAVLGRDFAMPSMLTQQISAAPMRHVLRDHLLSIQRYRDQLAPDEQALLLNQAVQLALFTLARPSPVEGDRSSDGRLLSAALAYIERHLAEPDLSANRVAKALGYSRATLYRLFNDYGTGVAEHIRDLRLGRVRHMIEREPVSVSISEIATQCGIYDTANLSRQFRRRFGIAPNELRSLRREET